MGVIGRRQQLVVARRVAICPQLDAGAVQSCPGQPAVEAHHLLGAPAVGSGHGAGQQGHGHERGVGDRERLLPVVDAFIADIDLAAKRITITPPDGFPEEPL